MSENEIVAYFHCRKCVESLPPGKSPQEWARIEAGFTEKGVQIWCVRHDLEIINLNFGESLNEIDLHELCEHCAIERPMPPGSE